MGIELDKESVKYLVRHAKHGGHEGARAVMVLKALGLDSDGALLKYDPDEARDERGRWSGGSGESSSGRQTVASTLNSEQLQERVATLRSGGYSNQEIQDYLLRDAPSSASNGDTPGDKTHLAESEKDDHEQALQDRADSRTFSDTNAKGDGYYHAVEEEIPTMRENGATAADYRSAAGSARDSAKQNGPADGNYDPSFDKGRAAAFMDAAAAHSDVINSRDMNGRDVSTGVFLP